MRTNFQMPDVPSIALGGGSIIKSDEITVSLISTSINTLISAGI